MANKRTKKRYGPNMFDGGGFQNFINSDTFQNISKGMKTFNSSEGGSGSFLSMNQGGGGGGGLFGAIGSSVDTTGQMFSAIDRLLTKPRKPLAKTIGLYAKGGRLYAAGGGMGAEGFMNMGTTAMALAGNAVQNAQIADTSDIQDQIRITGTQPVAANTNDELMDAWSGRTELSHVSRKDLRNKSLFGDFANSLSASGQGFSAGSAAGPWGAAIGGIVGGVSSVVGSIIGRKKAKKKAKKLNTMIDEANERSLRALEDRTSAVERQSDLNMLANYSAYGGPLDFGGGAIDYELDNEDLQNQKMSAVAKLKLTSLPNSFQALPELNTYNAFAEGGGLSRGKDYKPKKKPYPMVESGDFAGPHRSYPIPTKADARDALRLAGLHGNSSVRAKVLAKYPSLKHANGGPLFLDEDIQWNDETPYMFADGGGIHIKKENRGKFTEYCGGKVTSACIAKGKRSPSGAVRKRANFADVARGWEHAFGGWLNTQGGDFSNGVTVIGNGGTHEENPNDGVLMGMDPNGVPNLVEEGEVVYNDYVFSNRTEVPEDVRKKLKLRGKTFADAAKHIQKESVERPNDPISNRNLTVAMGRLADAQEEIRAKEAGDKYPEEFAYGGYLFAKGGDKRDRDIPSVRRLGDTPIENIPDFSLAEAREGTSSTRKKSKKRPTWMRYAPIAEAGMATIADLFSSPDYSNPNMILGATSNLSTVPFSPLGNYLSYSPLDKNFYLNKIAANAAATRRGILDTSGGNRAAAQAGLLAADYNYGTSMGELARQAEEYNQAQKERVEGFNRSTNQYNSEAAMRAAIANKQNEEMRFRGAVTAAQMREAIRAQDEARRSGNLNNLFQGLGDMGWENEQANWLDTLADSGVLKMNTSGEYTGGTKAKGGRVRTKKKKGLTYA